MSDTIVAGDAQGRHVIYDDSGNLIAKLGEHILKVARGWDMNAQTPWRRWLPRIIFQGFGKAASSQLYVTTMRIVLVREIDPGRELAGEMTPLGMPNAVARGAELKKLAATGYRQFCEVHPATLSLSKVRRSRKGLTWLGLDVLAKDDTKYSISFWKTDGEDLETLALLETQFHR